METQQQHTAKTLAKAIRWLCRPLIKLCIEKGIGFPQFREMCKEIYVEVAENNFSLDDKAPSDSRIYLLTGVHRKDIKRLRNEAEKAEDEINLIPTLSGELVAHWTGLAEFQDENGQARCLSRASENNQPGFDELVRQVSKDIRPRAILDEWLRLGIVHVDENELICLNQAAFVPQKDLDEQAFYLGRNVHDHLAACAHNIAGNDAPMLERSVYYARLTEESVIQLRKQAAEKGMDLLQDLNRQALKLQKADEGKPAALKRMRFGCYWYEEQKQSAKGSSES